MTCAVKTASRKIIIVFVSLLWGEMIKLLGESLSYSPGCPIGEGVKQCVKRRWSEVRVRLLTGLMASIYTDSRKADLWLLITQLST